MNVNDTEVIFAILEKAGYERTESMEEAEARLMALVHEFQIEDELKEAAEDESALPEGTPEGGRDETAEDDR